MSIKPATDAETAALALAASIDDALIRHRDGKVAAQEFVNFFAPRLQFFLQQLHAHHQIEDFHYFPIFRKAEARLLAGFDVLEADHATLHHDIESTVAAANGLLQSFSGDVGTLKRAADTYATASRTLFKGLKRHLDDEEDLIVPLILDRSEDKLGIGH